MRVRESEGVRELVRERERKGARGFCGKEVEDGKSRWSGRDL